MNSIARLDGVQSVSSGLTLNAIHIEGEVPEDTGQGAQLAPAPGQGGGGAPDSLDFDNRTLAGVDLGNPGIALVTPSQLSEGAYFSDGAAAKKEVVLSTSYAQRQGISVGDRIDLTGKKFTVVGIAQPPLGGQSSDIYLELGRPGRLQKLADREGRVNVVQVRAGSADAVGSLSTRIEQTISGAEVTTAEELADRERLARGREDPVGQARHGAGDRGPGGRVPTAGFLTLSSVTKRVRELGTLKAIGWRQWLVVRQISGESLAQGLLGGALGVGIGLGGAALIDAIGLTLEATVATANAGGGPDGPGSPAGFGQGQVASGSAEIALGAPVDPGLILLAIALALAGGLFAGALGGLRAARLRPAEALRHVG